MTNIKMVKAEDLFPEAIKNIKQTDIVLDIGCGIRPQNYIKPKIHICCEPHAEYIQFLQENNVNRDRTYVMMNSTWDIIKNFPSKSVDSIIFTDVIEHLEKNDGYELLKHAERVARVQVILFTPIGHLPQTHPDGKDAWGLNGGTWQEHKSGWYPGDFKGNWDIYGCERFYFANNVGEAFDKPFGAFWAILNMNPDINSINNTPPITVILPD